MKKENKQKGLSDGQLSAKYDTGKFSQKSFDKTLKTMGKTQVGSALTQAKKKK